MHDLISNLNWRYACKSFDANKKLSDSQLARVKESLRLAPSSFGLQPWRFLNIENKETRTQLRAKAWNQAQIEDASHLFVLCRPETIGPDSVERFVKTTAETRDMPLDALDGYKNVILGFMKNFTEEQKAAWMEKQIYCALGMMLTACAHERIDACPMEGFERDGVDAVLNLRAKGLRSVVLCTVGFRDESDKYATAAKVRYPETAVIENI